MSTFQSFVRVAIIVPALVLIGCQGQNTFKRTTNPTKDYQGVIDRSQTWKPGMGPRPPVTDFDNRQFYCGQVFTVAVGQAKRAEFHEGVSGAVAVSVTANTKTPFTVSLEGGPKEMKIKDLGQGTEFQLLWKPTREDAKHNTVKIVINAPELQKKCPIGFGDLIDIDVDPGPGIPKLSILDLPDAVEFGSVREFQVEMKDEAANATKVPVILEKGVDERLIANPESKLKNVGAAEAIFCETGIMKNSNDPTLWTFKCRFETSLLKDAEKILAKAPQTINAVFFLKGKSTASGLLTSQTSRAVQVAFLVKPVEAKPEVKAEPKADDKKVEPAKAATPAPAPAKPAATPIKPAANSTPIPPAKNLSTVKPPLTSYRAAGAL